MTSNYPGTTVELVSGVMPGSGVELIDTPGIYSLKASTREQEVTKEVLEGRSPGLIVNVVDGTNLGRHLSLTLALLNYGIPMILAVNCADRVRGQGKEVDIDALARATGTPAIATSAMTGEGVEELKRLIEGQISNLRIGPGLAGTANDLRNLQREAVAIAAAVTRLRPAEGRSGGPGVGERMERALDRPAAAVLGLAVSLVAAWAFISWALPAAESAVRLILDPVRVYLGSLLELVLPQGTLASIIAEAVPEGIVLPLATVLPAMILAYTLIAFLEDTGLLGRYAALGDTATGALSLPGQALIPFMLGFGCRVPAILSARILPSGEARRNASILIASLVPCAATISLGWATLARFRGNPAVPVAALALSALALSRALRWTSGRTKDPLVLELPPLRMPAIRNILVKTQMRLAGFFTHVLPLVVAMNIAIRVLMYAGVSPGSRALAAFSQGILGVPVQAFLGVLLTMLQRYLAPLFLLQLPLTAREATISVTMVALGFPCLPSAVTLWRELGPKAVAVSFLVSTCFFLGWGAALNLVLP